MSFFRIAYDFHCSDQFTSGMVHQTPHCLVKSLDRQLNTASVSVRFFSSWWLFAVSNIVELLQDDTLTLLSINILSQKSHFSPCYLQSTPSIFEPALHWLCSWYRQLRAHLYMTAMLMISSMHIYSRLHPTKLLSAGSRKRTGLYTKRMQWPMPWCLQKEGETIFVSIVLVLRSHGLPRLVAPFRTSWSTLRIGRSRS